MEFLSELHPVVIHFPIVLFTFYFLFEVSNIFTNLKFSATAQIFLVCGVLAGVFAVLSGNMAASINITDANITNPGVLKAVENHEVYASLTLWYFLAVLVLRTYFLIKKKLSKKMIFVFAVASLLGVVFVFYTGMYGGNLVYKFGIGTDLIK